MSSRLDDVADRTGLSIVSSGLGAEGRMLVSAAITPLVTPPVTPLVTPLTTPLAVDLSVRQLHARLDALVRDGELHEQEAALARSLPEARRDAFVAGRRALRAAIRAVAPDRADLPLLLARPLLRTTRGAPTLPFGVRGSISHKRTRAIAMAEAGTHGHLGVDLEERTPVTGTWLDAPPDFAAAAQRHRTLASRILTAREQDALATEVAATFHQRRRAAPAATEETTQPAQVAIARRTISPEMVMHDAIIRDATLLRFALKEAVYKAIDPVVQRYVRFTEVEVDVHEHGAATIHLMLPELDGHDAQLDAWWQMDDRWIMGAVRAEL